MSFVQDLKDKTNQYHGRFDCPFCGKKIDQYDPIRHTNLVGYSDPNKCFACFPKNCFLLPHRKLNPKQYKRKLWEHSAETKKLLEDIVRFLPKVNNSKSDDLEFEIWDPGLRDEICLNINSSDYFYTFYIQAGNKINVNSEWWGEQFGGDNEDIDPTPEAVLSFLKERGEYRLDAFLPEEDMIIKEREMTFAEKLKQTSKSVNEQKRQVDLEKTEQQKNQKEKEFQQQQQYKWEQFEQTWKGNIESAAQSGLYEITAYHICPGEVSNYEIKLYHDKCEVCFKYDRPSNDKNLLTGTAQKVFDLLEKEGLNPKLKIKEQAFNIDRDSGECSYNYYMDIVASWA